MKKARFLLVGLAALFWPTGAIAQAPGMVVFTMVTTASCVTPDDPSFMGYNLQDFPQGNPSTVTFMGQTSQIACPFSQTVYLVNGQPITLPGAAATATPTP